MSGGREARSLACPPPDDLAGFPQRVLESGEEHYRVARAGHEPWWFSNAGTGRFDLTRPAGTCYLASDALAALVEVVGAELESGTIGRAFLDRRRIHVVTLPRSFRVADCTSGRARGFGVTAELGTTVPYACPQQWAAALRAGGAEGIRYHLRHVPFSSPATALFDDATHQPATAAERPDGFVRLDWPSGGERRIDDGDVRRLADEFSIQVARRPRLDEVVTEAPR